MRFALACCGLVLQTVFSLAADEKPNPADKSDPPKEKFIPLGSAAGVLQGLPGEDGLLKIKVTIRYLEPNVQAQVNLLREEQQLMGRQAAAMRIRNPLQRQQEFMRIYQSAQNLGRENLFQVKEVQKDLEFETADETKYRIAAPPAAFDDKGNPKIYTRAELKELKGPEHLPGYPVEKDELRRGQTVMVTAARKRSASGEKELAVEKPIALLILIVGEK